MQKHFNPETKKQINKQTKKQVTGANQFILTSKCRSSV